MSVNPVAVVFWIFCALVGYLLGDVRGALIGVALSMGLGIVLAVIDGMKQ